MFRSVKNFILFTFIDLVVRQGWLSWCINIKLLSRSGRQGVRRIPAVAAVSLICSLPRRALQGVPGHPLHFSAGSGTRREPGGRPEGPPARRLRRCYAHTSTASANLRRALPRPAAGLNRMMVLKGRRKNAEIDERSQGRGATRCELRRLDILISAQEIISGDPRLRANASQG